MSTTGRLTGWGRTQPSVCRIAPLNPVDPGQQLADGRDSIARGLGRSYGDAATNGGGQVLVTTGEPAMLWLAGGTLRATGGTSLEMLMRRTVPHGYFPPVTPGTRNVTVGGMLAADVHGKNHHRDGSIGNHVRRITLATGSGAILSVTPHSDPELFWATIGGMGLTGVILDADLELTPIASSEVLATSERAGDLEQLMSTLAEHDRTQRYSVAWIDLAARGRRFGRGVVTSGDFAWDGPLEYRPKRPISGPGWAPTRLLNPHTVRAFNAGWYHKAPKTASASRQSITEFFHPLDAISNWNRLYGRSGFIQYQFSVPFGAENLLADIARTLGAASGGSFLAVLKRFGAANPGMLSFPSPGWTLALDLPTRLAHPALLDRLDRRIVDAGGRIYLAKDSRMDPSLMPDMYPQLTRFRNVLATHDPDRRLNSDLARRLSLRGSR